MLCRASDDMMSLRLDGMLAPDEIRRLEEHLSSCPDCRAQYLLMREADSLLRLSARMPLPPPSDFSARVMQRVAATPVTRPSMWERERAQVQGGRQTVRLNPTAPISGMVVLAPSNSLPPPQSGLRQLLDVLRNGWVRTYLGGLSLAGVASALVLAVLTGLWLNGGLATPPVLNEIAATDVKPSTVLGPLTSWLQQAETLALSINPWLYALLAAVTVALSLLWWRVVSSYIRSTEEVQA